MGGGRFGAGDGAGVGWGVGGAFTENWKSPRVNCCVASGVE